MLLPTDPFSAITHLLGALAFAIAGVFLLKRADPHWRRWPLAIFVCSAILLLLASTLFHTLPSGSDARAVAKRLDHAAIFVLIAGTFTPIHMILFKGALRWGVLAFVWTSAITGLVLKIIFFNDVPETLGVSAYLALGWVGLFSMVIITKRWGARFVSPMVLGGLAYTVGAVCEFTGQPTLISGVIQSHEVFHLAVLVGLGCHWMFIRRMSVGEIPERLPRKRAGQVAQDPGGAVAPQADHQNAEERAA